MLRPTASAAAIAAWEKLAAVDSAVHPSNDGWCIGVALLTVAA